VRARPQEDEARFRPGTNKWVAFKVLREAGASGLSVPQIMERSKKAGLKQWDDNAKRIIQFVRGPAPRAGGDLAAPARRCCGPARRPCWPSRLSHGTTARLCWD